MSTPDEISAKILAIFDAAMRRRSGYGVSEYAVIDDAEADRIQRKTGFDLHGWSRDLTEDAVRHIRKKHGNPKTEEPRGQIAVTREHFAKLHWILKNADEITATKTRQGLDAIRYEKQINGYVVIIEEKRNDQEKKMSLTSIYIYKRKPAGDT